MATFKLEIITPQKVIYSNDVDMLITRTTEGDMGILANHAPLVTELAIGEMKIKIGKDEEKYFVSSGFLEVSKEKVLILADKAMKADEIDIEKAKKEKEVLEAKLKKLNEDRDIAATEHSLKEALTKIKIGETL
ncbi:ATP synthase F1 subunit epsilon [Haliovirga abyssi]|uniref:ATP synthase epsilon chain n=1 Tax=Haliovirga abyssi TaxID=2996794 RepID=A0AAU9D8V3_9FUSO|nr:ATP synthase F1 subunit epsilon [Haliovirga abyssi]BDU50016.1 ATP synthase epsilon chain [Haliovirga abyssi]